MSELLAGIKADLERNDGLRLAVLTACTLLLALAFLVLLISDQVQAAAR
ncbi:MAG: hypothetical protein ACRDGE_03260 [Candidatus Limnocylindria bacterium]